MLNGHCPPLTINSRTYKEDLLNRFGLLYLFMRLATDFGMYFSHGRQLWFPSYFTGPSLWHITIAGFQFVINYCIVLYCIVLYCIVSYRIVSYRIVSHRIASHRIASHCIAAQSIALHCMYCIVDQTVLCSKQCHLSQNLIRYFLTKLLDSSVTKRIHSLKRKNMKMFLQYDFGYFHTFFHVFKVLSYNFLFSGHT